MGWITITIPGNPTATKHLQGLLDEGKEEWELDLERKQGRPDLLRDQLFDDAREGDGHR